jgi:hypothetical protein
MRSSNARRETQERPENVQITGGGQKSGASSLSCSHVFYFLPLLVTNINESVSLFTTLCVFPQKSKTQIWKMDCKKLPRRHPRGGMRKWCKNGRHLKPKLTTGASRISEVAKFTARLIARFPLIPSGAAKTQSVGIGAKASARK